MDYRILDVRKRLMNRQYAISTHAQTRIYEQNIFGVAEIIAHLGEVGQVDSGFNQGGLCWTFDAVFEGQPFRMVVGRHKYNPDLVFIVSLFLVKPGIKKGQNYCKFGGKTLSYSFEFSCEVA